MTEAVKRAVAGALPGVVLLVCASAVAQATTGPGIIFRSPRYKVPAAVQRQFAGTYGLRQRRGASRLMHSTMVIRRTDMGFLDGVIETYEYVDGRPSTEVATLYDFRYRGRGRMDANIVDDGGDRIGGLSVHRHSGGGLSGSLAQGSRHFRVSYRRRRAGSGAASAQGQPLRVGRGNQPTTTRSRPGWGAHQNAYLGDYRVASAKIVGRPSGARQVGAGGELMFGLRPLVRDALKELADSNPVQAGHLTIFLSVSSGGGIPTGVLNARGADGPKTYQLTDLSYRGARRRAVVRVGGEHGRVVGGFSGHSTRGGKAVTGVLNLRGQARVAVTFARGRG